jgi:hypothetical protein
VSERKFKLDIFDLLRRVDAKEADIYSRLSADERTGFSALIAQRWLSGTKDTGQVIALANFSNRAVFSLARHPHLQLLLLQACASGRQHRYAWLPFGPKTGHRLYDKAVMEFLGVSNRELRQLDPQPTSAEAIEMATQLGWQKEELAALEKELK